MSHIMTTLRLPRCKRPAANIGIASATLVTACFLLSGLARECAERVLLHVMGPLELPPCIWVALCAGVTGRRWWHNVCLTSAAVGE